MFVDCCGIPFMGFDQNISIKKPTQQIKGEQGMLIKSEMEQETIQLIAKQFDLSNNLSDDDMNIHVHGLQTSNYGY